MRNKKYLIIFVKTLFLFAGSGLYIKKHLTPTIANSLNKEGYTTIFETTNPSFKIWENHYLKNKKDLVNDNIVLQEDITDKEGALLFKNWCKTTLDSKSKDLFEKAKKYCTMNFEIFALENKNVELISNLKVKHKKGIWSNAFNKHKEEINRLGILRKAFFDTEERSAERFKTWCRKKSKEPYIPKNYLISAYFSVWCVIDKKDLNN